MGWHQNHARQVNTSKSITRFDMLKATWPEVVDALCLTLMILICVFGSIYIALRLIDLI